MTIQPAKTYRIQVNSTNLLLRKIALCIGLLAFVGFAIWWLVTLPVNDTDANITIAYYINLPRWLWDIFEGTIILTIVSFLLYDVRKNSNGYLQIEKDSILIKLKKTHLPIKLSELKRISFVVKTLTLSPYRIEFIYPNRKLIRIKMLSGADFDELFKIISNLSPKELEIDINSIEEIGE